MVGLFLMSLLLVNGVSAEQGCNWPKECGTLDCIVSHNNLISEKVAGEFGVLCVDSQWYAAAERPGQWDDYFDSEFFMLGDDATSSDWEIKDGIWVAKETTPESTSSFPTCGDGRCKGDEDETCHIDCGISVHATFKKGGAGSWVGEDMGSIAVDGKHGSVGNFPGTGYLDLTSSVKKLLPSVKDAVVSMWVYPKAIGGDKQGLFVSGVGNHQYGRWGMVLEQDGSVVVSIYDNVAQEYAQAKTTTILENDKWYNIVGVWDKTSNKIKVYVNGVLENEVDFSGWANIELEDEKENRLGSIHRNKLNHYYTGYFDDVRFFDELLDDAQIKQLYDAYQVVSGSEQRVIDMSLHSGPKVVKQAEIDYWVEQLDTEAMTLEEIAEAFVLSDEYNVKFVRNIYKHFLGRDAGDSEVVYWASILENKKLREEFIRAMALSDEFSGTDSTEYVRKLYMYVLGWQENELDQDDIDSWAGRVDLEGKEAVVDAFMNTEEYRKDIVIGFYEIFLNRGPEDDNVVNLKTGYESEKDLMIVFLNSQEYFDLKGTKEKVIKGFYEDVLGRTLQGAVPVATDGKCINANVNSGKAVSPKSRLMGSTAVDYEFLLENDMGAIMNKEFEFDGKKYVFNFSFKEEQGDDIKVLISFGDQDTSGEYSETGAVDPTLSTGVKLIFVEVVRNDAGISTAKFKLSKDEILMYCDPFSFNYLPVKADDVDCSEDYQCNSNACLEGKCVPIVTKLQEQEAKITGINLFLKQIWCKLTNLFDGDDYKDCLATN